MIHEEHRDLFKAVGDGRTIQTPLNDLNPLDWVDCKGDELDKLVVRILEGCCNSPYRVKPDVKGTVILSQKVTLKPCFLPWYQVEITEADLNSRNLRLSFNSNEELLYAEVINQ